MRAWSSGARAGRLGPQSPGQLGRCPESRRGADGIGLAPSPPDRRPMQGASPAAARRDLEHGSTRPRATTVAGTPRPDRDARFTQLAPRLAEVTLDVRAGVWDPRTTWDPGRGWFTVLVLDGLLVGEASLDGVAAAHLRMAGDLVDPV